MWKPKILESDIQSENYKPESKPGAGDGQGWRLCKNGDFQIGTMSMIDGVIRSPHATVHIDRAMVDQASIEPAQLDLPTHQVRGDRLPHKGGPTDMEIVIKVDLPGVIDEMSAERKSALHQEIVQLVRDAAGVPRYAITSEQTCRAEADTALASRIGAIDLHAWAGVGASLDLQLGKEYLAIPQPGGDVKLGRLGGKPITAADFNGTPGCSPHEFAGGLCRELPRMDVEGACETFVSSALHRELPLAPMTGNGKVPLNNLPRPVDDDK